MSNNIRKSKKKRNSTRFVLRISPEEKVTLQQKASFAGISSAEFLRRCIITRRVFVRNKQLNYEVNRIGVNLNQISRHCNQGGTIDIAILRQLIEIESLLRKLL